MNNIGGKIRKLREKNGLSQEYLAIELGITQPSYARLEKDDERISITRLISIAKILQTSVSELIEEKINNLPEKASDNDSIKYIDTLMNAEKEHISTLKEEIVFLRKLLEAQAN